MGFLSHFCARQPVPPGFVSVPGSRATCQELWQARHLVLRLMWRDLTVRYRQTWLGWLWALLNPVLNLALYFGVFGGMVRLTAPDYTAPYVLVLLCGLVLWMLFSATVNAVGDSLLNNIGLLKKIYFPRTALTVAGTGVCLTDFVIALALLLTLVPACGVPLLPVRLPLVVVCAGLTALAGWGLGCLLAVLKLRFRDVRHVIPLVMQALFYATPVVWTPGLLSPRGQLLSTLNPLAGLLGLFRYAVVGGPLPSMVSLSGTVAGCLLMAVAGNGCFVLYEARVVDRE